MRVFECKDSNLVMQDTEYGLIYSTTPMLTAIKIFEAKESFQNINFEIKKFKLNLMKIKKIIRRKYVIHIM